ncbi:hypothetical protein [Methylobacterium sp. J-070]|uniref:hypothetical protein n=1 Tax=Methylobacterium sp. J-070 TaxID=2836650 RepID=UPI001FBBB464|nr:hypothetical protein [Methylobacterium sp. J-070]MCJ2048660.1 hypothetical protein [Methylobacterium sp. J-070]
MSIAIFVALAAGAFCLGGLSSLLPFGRREEDEPDHTLSYEAEFFDVGGPVIDLEPHR